MYRGFGWLGPGIPVLAVIAVGTLLRLCGLDWHDKLVGPRILWVFGLTLIVAGVAVFVAGRELNEVDGPLRASWARGRGRASHSCYGIRLENFGPLSILAGLAVLGYWAAHGAA